jgi:cysteine desulfurase
MNRPIYLDHNATTPVDPMVLQAMLPYFTQDFGNAMSTQYSYGWVASSAVETAREQVAKLIGAQAREIIFTAGTTESVHEVILGLFYERGPYHILTSAIEHKCVLQACARAETLGCTVTILPVSKFGQVSAAQVEAALRPDTALVSLMHANNEIGSLQPIAEIGELTRKNKIYFHVDAAQTLGKHVIDVAAMNIDLLSFSAHKLYGPKGVGGLYLRQTTPRVRLKPFIAGGQERGLRGGTHNVPGIVGLGAACDLAAATLESEAVRLTALRDHLIARCLTECKGARLNGHPTERLCNNVSVSVPGVLTDQLLLGMRDVAFSSASACTQGATFSHVLKAIGQPEDERLATLRFGLGRSTTLADVDLAADRLVATLLQNQKL